MSWQSVVIIASGPSLTVEDCALVQQSQRRVIVINTSYQRAPWADVLYACDDHWWNKHIQGVREIFKGELWTQSEIAAKKHGLHYIKSERKEGLGKGVIHQGSNSGFQAINLACEWGAKRIVLLGFDMSADRGKKHWHPDHDHVLSPYDHWIEYFKILAVDLKTEGIDVVNCTRRTALHCWPQVKLEDELAGAMSPA